MNNLPSIEDLVEETRREFPDLQLVYKRHSLLMKAVNAFLLVASFGRMRTFMDEFVTTFGHVMYLPDNWMMLSPLAKAALFRHERVHMRQQKHFGSLLFAFFYLLIPFPVVFARCRAEFEMEAYEESLRAYHEYGVDIMHEGTKESVFRNFTGPSYLWMWPFRKSLETWYDEVVRKILEIR